MRRCTGRRSGDATWCASDRPFALAKSLRASSDMMRPALFSACVALAALAALPLVSACTERADARPRMAVEEPKPEPRLSVPAGLQATVVATVPGARMMALGPDGAVYVSQPAANQITRLVLGADAALQSQTVAV